MAIMIHYSKLLLYQYLHHKDHDRSVYTWYKARLYMRIGAWIVYKLQHTSIHPNIITILYGIAGIVSGILLSIPNKLCVFVALLLFYFKGGLDWADGQLARIKDKCTKLGKALDPAMGTVGTISFYVGVGFYMGHRINYYCIPWIIMVVLSARIFGVRVSYACITDSVVLVILLSLLF